MASRFGTTAEMVIQDVEENGITYALAIDSKGLYLTEAKYLNSQLADPNRYAVGREAFSARLAVLGMNSVALFSENQSKIQVATGSGAKKVNPLKASKRSMKK